MAWKSRRRRRYYEGMWKQHPNFTMIEISNSGQVRDSQTKALKKGGRHAFGYRTVGLKMDGRWKNYTVHRLVLETFVGRCPDGMECRHLNGVPDDNRVENLAWGTHHKNMLDRHDHGTQTYTHGTQHGMSVLNTGQVRAIYLDSRLRCDIAAEYGVTPQNVSDIKNRRTWVRATKDLGKPPSKHQSMGQRKTTRAKLTVDQVREIRKDARTNNSAIARDYGVSSTNIRAIRLGQTWKDI